MNYVDAEPHVRLVHYDGDWIEIYIDGVLVYEGHESDVELGLFAQQITGEAASEEFRHSYETCAHDGCGRQGRLRMGSLYGDAQPRYCHVHWKNPYPLWQDAFEK